MSSLLFHTLAGDTSNAVTGSQNSTDCTLIVLICAYYAAGGSPTISDNKGNTWTALTNVNEPANGANLRMFYCANPNVGTGHTFSASGLYVALAVLGFDGDCTFLDAESTHNTTGSTVQPGSITPSDDGAIIICGLSSANNINHSIDSGFTETDENQFFNTPFFAEGLGAAYKIQSTAGAVNPTWTGGGSNGLTSAIAAFLPPPPDADPPEVDIISPADGTDVSEEFDVEVECDDIGNGVERLQVKIDGENFGGAFTGSEITGHTFTLDIGSLLNGEYEITVEAFDGYNTTDSNPITVNVQNPPVAGFSIPATGVIGIPVPITDLSLNAESYAYDKENNGSTDSTDDEPSFTFDSIGTYTVKQTVTNEFGSHNTTHTIVISEVLPLNYGFNSDEVELFCEANNLELSDGNNVMNFLDQSINGRDLTASSSYPTFQTNEINSLPVVRFSSSNPLKNTAQFTIRCGWILAKYDGATFPDTSDGYKGLLSDLVDKVILSGKRNTNEFFDADYDLFEFRSNDLISSENDNFELHAPAPMSAFKLIFFRFWKDLEVDGIQLGQELANTNRKWSGDVALLILTSRDFCEKEIRTRTEAMAEAYALTLADVIPFQGSKSDETTYSRAAYVYDPPEGERISEVLDDCKQSFDLNFNIRRNDEFKAFRSYYKNHYPEVPCVYRDYNLLPPEDIEGYFDSELKKSGFLQNNYSVRFKEK